MVAIAASLVIFLVGAQLALTSSSELAPFGWILAVVGAASLMINVRIYRRRVR